MERAEGPQSPYEVYCYNCQTSFAVGTRNCIHCGGRIGGSRFAMTPDLRQPTLEEHEVLAGDDEAPRRSRISPIAAMWVVLAIGGALYRACMGPQG